MLPQMTAWGVRLDSFVKRNDEAVDKFRERDNKSLLYIVAINVSHPVQGQN
jgi:hypothetical protein